MFYIVIGSVAHTFRRHSSATLSIYQVGTACISGGRTQGKISMQIDDRFKEVQAVGTFLPLVVTMMVMILLLMVLLLLIVMTW
jgi:hypothetical protein